MKTIVAFVLFQLVASITQAQPIKIQQGLLFKIGTSIRLGSVSVFDKRSRIKVMSNTIGVFNIPAQRGDTLNFTSEGFQPTDFVVDDFADKIVFMPPIVQLNTVVIKEQSLKSEIREVQRGYREKSVFYTGTPHYYYLVLKPMTFIYENFKSEVKEARHFNRYARMELASTAINKRFKDSTIKQVVPLKDKDLASFEMDYMPTLQQINTWNDYELINYIKTCYADYQKRTN